MHKIYITDGIVLEKRGIGEANSRASILTKDLGLVRASARSTRVEVSKLRYGLEPLTLARYCLVQGKHEWRLTGVESPERLLPPEAAGRAAIGRISQLLLRLVTGEEPLPDLYNDVIEGLILLSSAVEVQSIEVVMVLRILSHLGYLPQTPALAPFVESEFSMELSAKALEAKALLVRTINESLRATGL